MKDNMTTKTTLVLGGTGKTGRRVAKRLTARGLPVRIGSRSREHPFDWEDQATWAPALDGMGSVYLSYYPDLGVPGAAETVGSFADLAVKTGVRRLVLLAGRGEEGALWGTRAKSPGRRYKGSAPSTCSQHSPEVTTWKLNTWEFKQSFSIGSASAHGALSSERQ